MPRIRFIFIGSWGWYNQLSSPPYSTTMFLLSCISSLFCKVSHCFWTLLCSFWRDRVLFAANGLSGAGWSRRMGGKMELFRFLNIFLFPPIEHFLFVFTLDSTALFRSKLCLVHTIHLGPVLLNPTEAELAGFSLREGKKIWW